MYGRGSQSSSNGGGRRGSGAGSSSRNRGGAQHHHQQQAAVEETDEFGRVKRRADDDQQQPRRTQDDRPSTSSSSTRRRREDDPRASGSGSSNDNRRAADRRANAYDSSAYHRDAAAAWGHPAAAYPPGAQDYYGVDPYAAAAYGVPTGPSGYYAQEAAAAAAQWGMPYAAGYYGAPPPTGPRDPYGASRSRPRDRDRDRVAATDTAGSSSSSSRNSSQRVRDERTTASSSRKRTLSPSQSASRDESAAGSTRDERRGREREQERERETERDRDRTREEQRPRKAASPPLRAPTSPRRKPAATLSPAITAPDPDARTKARRAASRSATAKDVWVDSLNYTDMEEDTSSDGLQQAKTRSAGSPTAVARKASPSAPSGWSPSQRQPPTGPRAERAPPPASPPKSAPTGPAASRPATAASRQSGGGRASQSPELDRRANGGRKRSRTPANQPHTAADSPTTQPGRRKASVSPETSKRIKWTRGGEVQAGEERSTTPAQPPPPPAAPRQILEVASTDPSVPAVMTTLASSPIRDPHAAAEDGDDDDDDDDPTTSESPPLSSSSPPRAPPQELYTRIAQVGEGTYGQVFKARSHPSNHLVALKKIRMESEKDGFPITAMREVKLLQMLRHPNVVRLHEMMTTLSGGKVGAVYMVFEYMEHDLNGVLHHPSIQFTEANRRSLASQLLHGLAYLHSKSVLHRDLKGSNILLNALGQLKLADFGLARLYAKRRTDADYTNRVVTLWYRPPELLLGATRYGTEVDTWGAGCIFLELWTKQAVFQGQDEIDQVGRVVDVLGPMGGEGRWEGVGELPWWELIRPTPPKLEEEDIAAAESSGRDPYSCRFRRLYTPLIPPSALDVAEALLTYDPRKRASAAQALEMPYFTEEKPRPRMPREALGRLKGEWHELESRRARGRGAAGGGGRQGGGEGKAGEREKKEEAVAVNAKAE